ncbi:MAG: ASKHA domain-containing protein [Defluviitaleaceae bacterium]|nr:ASKHA domain-containing protein [Defluviitaleaceae bacterium]
MSKFGIAADIGTTNVALALVDLASGEIAARHDFPNPQRAFGADVISRINAANAGHLHEMQRLISCGISAGTNELRESVGVRGECMKTVIAGNTAMLHLLCGLSCEGLAKYPFRAEKIPFACIPRSANTTGAIPHLSPFIGGDVVAGLLYVMNMPDALPSFLLLDLGTNGETALYNNGKITTASAAAGPAFERTRGGASATIAELARLVRIGAIDETGLYKSESRPDEKSHLSQKKIRDLQLAKSAVRSGLEILIEESGEPRTVFLAGGIGEAMRVADAVEIGLIPPHFAEKTVAVGNSSLGGAIRMLVEPAAAQKDLDEILQNHAEIILAEHPRFNDLFIKFLDFGGIAPEPPRTF